LGYEDLNEHSDLRRDLLLAAAVGKEDVLGEDRRCAKDAGFACASPATLNRLELGANFSDRYRKVHANPQAVEAAVLELGVRCLPSDSEVLVLDFDATDDPLHGHQEGRFFHGYYGNYCYLPLYCFCGSVPLWAQLRMSDKDASAGTVEALGQIVAAIRRRLPKVKIVVRGDSGFAREAIMAWCEGIMSQGGEVLVEGEVRSLYEKEYCGRGNAENMIKQMVLDLKADRTSCSWMAANQMRDVG